MAKKFLNPTPPIPGMFQAICKWFRHRFGLNLYGGRWNFENGFYVGGVHVTPEDIKALKSALAPEIIPEQEIMPEQETIELGQEITQSDQFVATAQFELEPEVVTKNPRRPRNKHPAVGEGIAVNE